MPKAKRSYPLFVTFCWAMVSNPLTFNTPSPEPLATDLQAPQGSQNVVLRNISWQQYEGLLELLGDRPCTRIAYDNGILEIMTPLPEHEYFKQSISSSSTISPTS